MQRSARLLATMTTTIALLGACHSGMPGSGSPPAPATPRSGYVAALIDTVASHMALLELERVTIQATMTPTNPMLLSIDRRLTALHDQLAALPDAAAAEAIARARVLRALDERLAGLTVEQALLHTTATPDNLQFTNLAARVTVVQKRQSELRAMAARAGSRK